LTGVVNSTTQIDNPSSEDLSIGLALHSPRRISQLSNSHRPARSNA
jgi:hypothetical protein